MSDHTPSTDEVVGAYMMERGRLAISFSEANEEFDRWLADHDKEVAARACATMLHEWRTQGSGDFYGWCTVWWQNEYRVADQNGGE